jgi:hypothetical protein
LPAQWHGKQHDLSLEPVPGLGSDSRSAPGQWFTGDRGRLRSDHASNHHVSRGHIHERRGDRGPDLGGNGLSRR